MPDNALLKADRYTVIACQINDLPAKLRACERLQLQYLVKDEVPGHCLLYIFFDKAGMQNYLLGHYDVGETSTSSCSSHNPRPYRPDSPSSPPETQPTGRIGGQAGKDLLWAP